MDASLALIIPERFRARHWSAWNTAVSLGKSRYAEGQILAVPAIRKDGQQISIEFSIQLLADQSAIAWVVAVIRDVTDRYQRDKALRAELQDLKALGVFKQGPIRTSG